MRSYLNYYKHIVSKVRFPIKMFPFYNCISIQIYEYKYILQQPLGWKLKDIFVRKIGISEPWNRFLRKIDYY